MIKTSDSVKEISPALVAFQADIEAVKKGADNPFFKSKYADLPSILTAIKEDMESHGLAVIQSIEPTNDDGGLSCMTRIIHKSGEWIQTGVYLTAEKQTPQGYGSAITYLRRYGIQTALGLSAEDDDGNGAENPKKKPATKSNRKPASKPSAKLPDWAVDCSAETQRQIKQILKWKGSQCQELWDGIADQPDVAKAEQFAFGINEYVIEKSERDS